MLSLFDHFYVFVVLVVPDHVGFFSQTAPAFANKKRRDSTFMPQVLTQVEDNNYEDTLAPLITQ